MSNGGCVSHQGALDPLRVCYSCSVPTSSLSNGGCVSHRGALDPLSEAVLLPDADALVVLLPELHEQLELLHRRFLQSGIGISD